MFERAALGAALALSCLAPPAQAQDWRDVTSFRQHSGEARLDVRVRYGAGRLRIGPGVAGELYRVGIRYDSEVFDPITKYSAGRLEVGVEGTSRGIRVRHRETGEMNLALSPDIPLDLRLSFGAVEGELDFGGLRIARLSIETGATSTEVRFTRPNPIPCDRFDLALGAAALRVEGLGHANCQRLKVDGGVGDITLDFGGEWRRNVGATVSIALGSLTLVVPRDVGVRLNRRTFLTGFDGDGFERRGREHLSRNWETARYRLDVDLSGAFGSVNVRWAPPTTAATP